jgi:opacity protein-like surface antigen
MNELRKTIPLAKYLLIALFACRWVADAGADQMRLGVGLAFPQQDLGHTSDRGIDVLAQYLRAVHANFDAGLQGDWISFGKSPKVGYSIDDKLQSSVESWSLMAVAKVHLANTPSGASPYGLLGAGVAKTSSSGKTETASGGDKTDLTLGAATGIDLDFKNGWGGGLDFRYQTLKVQGIPHASFISALVHLSFL